MGTQACSCGKCEECKRERFSRRGVLGALVGAAAAATATAASAREPEQPVETAEKPLLVLKKLEKEAFANLKSLFVSQKSYYAERDCYSTDLDQIGFAPDEWCEDAARLRIKEKPTAFKKVGCHFIYEVETLGKGGAMQFRAYARGAVEPVLGVNYLVESSGEFVGIPRRNPK